MAGTKILNSYYLTQLNQALTNHLARNSSSPRIAIIGVGNELNGDDSAGVLVSRRISQSIQNSKFIYNVEGSISPENYTAPIRRFKPDWIWLIDAADFNQKPGAVRILPLDQVNGVSNFTHGLPLNVLAEFLQKETNSVIFLFGIQPLNVEPFTSISEIVKFAVDDLASKLTVWLKKYIIH
ncbi:MAG: hydrogenase 3 maturation endopeptidase HyCI [Anaerolineaceae bacterium]